MTERCLELEDLFAHADRGLTGDTLVHVQSCPRCRARLKLNEAFVAAEPLRGSNSADADSRLTVLLREWARTGQPATHGEPPVVPERQLPRERRGWFEPVTAWFGGSALRPVMVATVLVVVAGGVIATTRLGNQEPVVLREASGPAMEFAVVDATPVDGAIQFRWLAAAGAESYRLRILAPDLSELRVFPATPETSLTVPLDSLPAAPQPGAPLVWRVDALSGGGPVAQSTLGALFDHTTPPTPLP